MSFTQQQQQKLLSALLKKPQNSLCADCNSKSPCWASLDFGVFVCMNCSGAHRSLGQSVTRIKSTKLDAWNKDWLWHMQLGNCLINQYFQARLNPIVHKKPNPNSSLPDIKKYVNDKYVRRLFSKQGEDDPITNLKNGKPPIRTSPPSEGAKKVQPNSATKKQPAKSYVPQTQAQISVKPLVSKKIDSLLDEVSDASNRAPSQKNQKVREQVNLFDEIEEPNSAKLGVGISVKGNSQVNHQHQNLFPHHGMYNKQHFNSFSGTGAKHSSTGAVNFNDIFNHGSNTNSVQKKNTDFEIFKTLTPNTVTSQNLFTTVPNATINPFHTPISHFGHVHQHNLPHMHVHTTGVGSQYGHTHGHHIFVNPPPQHQHTGMNANINLGAPSNVINISLQDTGKSSNKKQSSASNQAQHLKLDIKDFKLQQKQSQKDKNNKASSNGKSWVDQWK